MTKADLEKAHKQLKAEHEKLQKSYAKQTKNHQTSVVQLVAAEGEVIKLKNDISVLRDELEAVKDSEHAMRCVRLPYLDSEVERLTKLSKDYYDIILEWRMKYLRLIRAYGDLAASLTTLKFGTEE